MNETTEITKDQALELLHHFWNMFVSLDVEHEIADELMTDARAEENPAYANFAWELWGDFTVTCDALREHGQAINSMLVDLRHAEGRCVNCGMSLEDQASERCDVCKACLRIE